MYYTQAKYLSYELNYIDTDVSMWSVIEWLSLRDTVSAGLRQVLREERLTRQEQDDHGERNSAQSCV